MRKVTKSDLIDAVHKHTSCGRRLVQDIVEQVIDELKASLISGATIEIRGFGTFEPRLRKGRELARNPRTGERLSVKPHYVAAFRSGRELKRELWNLQIMENPTNVSQNAEI